MCSTLYKECVGSFTSHRFITCARACETGHMVYRPYPRRLESLTFADIITKTALSPQLVKDPERWSSQGLNLRPPDLFIWWQKNFEDASRGNSGVLSYFCFT